MGAVPKRVRGSGALGRGERLQGWVFDPAAQVFRLPDWERRGLVVLCSTRLGGVSRGPYGSMNLSLGVGDDPGRVEENRRRLAGLAGVTASRVVFAQQVHGTRVARIGPGDEAAPRGERTLPATDGVLVDRETSAPVLLFADCVPVLVHARRRRLVGIAHAGWRGAAGGVLLHLLEAARAAGAALDELEVALGPSIGPECYPVGEDVVEAFAAAWPWSRRHVRRQGADLRGFLAEQAARAGVEPRDILSDAPCTACDPRLYSHRRDGPVTGRQGVIVGLAGFASGEGDRAPAVEAVAEEIR